MGEPNERPALSPQKQEAMRLKLAELEALGVPTESLRRTMQERPQDFEREADEAMRRELQGADFEEPAAEPLPEAAPQEVRISGAGEGEAPAEPTPELAPAGEVPFPPVEPQEAPARPEVPPDDELGRLAAALAEVMQPLPARAVPAPEPAVLETPPVPPTAFEAELADELKQALEEAPPAETAPPPLADGGSLSMGATARVSAPAAPAAPGVKPPPPTGRAAPMKPQRVVVLKAGGIAPPGAKPVAAAAAAPPEVLPTAVAPRRRFGTAAAAALVVVMLVGTYLLLVNTAPSAAFTFSPNAPAAGQDIVFSANATTDPNGDEISFRWEFGDGANATGRVVHHTYGKSGQYLVNLTATDDHKNSKRVTQTVVVMAGSIRPPVYRYGDSLGYNVAGTSHIEGVGTPLTTVNFTFGGQEVSCRIDAVDLGYTGPQTREVKSSPQTAKDGFLDEHQTYVVARRLPSLQLAGRINTSCQDTDYAGTANLDESDYVNPNNNDTVRAETFEAASVTVQADIPKTYTSSAHLTDFPELANASNQLHLEEAYAGRTFSTENFSSGQILAEGLTWSWVTRGTEVVAGFLCIKIHFEATNLPPQYIGRLYIDLWVSSVSSFPLREVYYVRGYGTGTSYESNFEATATGPGEPGSADIPFTSNPRSYRTVAPADLAPMGKVPRANISADFAFTPQTAYTEAIPRCGDFANFTIDNPQAYSVNGTYSLAAGNPRWMLEFAQDKSGERARIENEHSTSTQVRCGGGSVGAQRPLSQIGQVVSLNYAADLLKQEQSANALFPVGAFDAAHANFTIKQELKLPSVSFNAATAAARAAVPLAFGGESFSTETTRTTAYVDAKSGQIVYVLTESGDKLP